jgi:predicted phosphodiesterase
MRIAALSDIHGNLHALEAVLEDAERAGADRIVVAGDVAIGGPDSLACWHTVIARGLPIVRGNHERYLLAAAAGEPAYAAVNWQPARWSAARFAPDDLTAIAELPLTLTLDDVPDLCITHSAPTDDYAYLTPDTPDGEVTEAFRGVPAATAVRGHYHRAFERRLPGLHLVSIGSAGLPLAGSTDAEYALLERTGEGWSAEHRRVPYDLTGALAAYGTSGYLEGGGPVARLFQEELRTAEYQIVPFFRRYREVWEGEGVGLEEGVGRWLTGVGG